MDEAPRKLDYARAAPRRHWPWWFDLLFAQGTGLLFIAFIVMPSLTTGNGLFFGIPWGPAVLDAVILAMAVYAKLIWELYKWYSGRA